MGRKKDKGKDMTDEQKASECLARIDSICVHIPGMAGTACRICAVAAMVQFAQEQIKELEG